MYKYFILCFSSSILVLVNNLPAIAAPKGNRIAVMSEIFFKLPQLIIPYLIILGMTYKSAKNQEEAITTSFGILMVILLFFAFVNPAVLDFCLGGGSENTD